MRVVAKHMLEADGTDRLVPFLIDQKPADAALTDVQLFRDVLGGEYLKMYEALTAHAEFFYPLMFPPGVSDEKLNILRRAFTATVGGPKLVMEAQTAGISLETTRGEEIEAVIPKIMDLPEGVRRNLRLLLGGN